MSLAYSVPTYAGAMGDGRCHLTFQNPNGTSSSYFSNWTREYLQSIDPNFVNPPSWDDAQAMCSVPLAGRQGQIDYAAELARRNASDITTISQLLVTEQQNFNARTNAINTPYSGPVESETITASGVTQNSNSPSGSNTVQGTGTSNSSSGHTPGSATGNIGSGFLDNYLLGLKSVLSPGDWMDIISSGNIGAIAGLVTIPIITLKFVKGKGHRR